MKTNILPHSVEGMAIAYKNAEDEFENLMHSSLQAMRQLINAQYSYISSRINIEFVDTEPYGETPKIKDVVADFNSGRLFIHTTGNDSKVWGKFTNLQFRAVHDYIHCLHNLEFNHKQEIEAYHKQFEFSVQPRFTDMFPFINWDTFNRILRSEIVYQSAFKEHFGTFHIEQKLVLKTI